MNWDDTKVFLAVCRETTLRGAARVLGIDQATVGRRIAALERSLNATLFLRTSDGYVLTALGEAALEAAQNMESSAQELQRRIEGQDDRLTGLVRITTTDSMAIDFLIPAIASLHLEHPDVRVQLEASTHMLNLSKREADIAIRTVKPDNPDLIVRRVARWPVALFASAGYLLKRGIPERGSAFAGHDLVVYQPHFAAGKELTLASEPITRGRIVSSVNSSVLMRRSIATGIGIGEIPVYMGEQEGLVRLWPEQPRSTPYDVWLVTHADLRHTARIKVVIDKIVEVFGAANPP